MTAGYRYHRSVLQVLQSNGCAGRWTLKSPGHALALDALTAVYPDARLVVLHRDPVVLTASVCSLIHTMSSAFSDVDHRDYIRDHWTAHARGLHRRRSTPTRTGCTTCSTPTSSPTRSARWPRSTTPWVSTRRPEAFDAMSALVAERPQGSLGVHRYDLASYGLVEDELRERFAGYVDRYDVPREMGTG